jgi:copper oxidase (laccase) domain-containing protein
VNGGGPLESFDSLSGIPGIVHGFTGRIPGIDVNLEREHALARLNEAHGQSLRELGLGDRRLIVGEQTHGAEVAIVDASSPSLIPTVDGLITTDRSVCLGVYVADCGPVYVVDPIHGAIALLHSGKKGTELGITAVAIRTMQERFGSEPSEMIVQLGPCIRTPLYEIDFAGEILRQAKRAGVRNVHDCCICTGTAVDRFYSYRVEKGRTGRMLAILALA